VANGSQALYNNTTGSFNTATEFRAFYSNTTGSDNTANGFEALAFNTTGQDNMANGFTALYNNTTGSNNTGTGFYALFSNTTGSDNTANGSGALGSNTTGNSNTANGFEALATNTTGSDNTANGQGALLHNFSGNDNTANGSGALFHNGGDSNTANGYHALYGSLDSGNTALGYLAGSNLVEGSDNIYIGNAGNVFDRNTILIGDSSLQSLAFIAGIRGVTTGNADAVAVVIDSAGQLGTMSSSWRFKKEIKPMGQTSEAILACRPVTFQYKSDPTGTAQFGLIAEEVAKVDPDLVVRDAGGEIYTVRYDAVNAMLLNEFLKEHCTVQELKSTAAKQETTIARQQKQIEALTTGLQKVSDQLELSTSAPQMAGNNNR
jgi:Chaperone of endosialidase